MILYVCKDIQAQNNSLRKAESTRQGDNESNKDSISISEPEGRKRTWLGDVRVHKVKAPFEFKALIIRSSRSIQGIKSIFLSHFILDIFAFFLLSFYWLRLHTFTNFHHKFYITKVYTIPFCLSKSLFNVLCSLFATPTSSDITLMEIK